MTIPAYILSFLVLILTFSVQVPVSYAMELVIEGSGSAEVTYDGETSEYPLQIGFGLDTDFSNPENAIILFSVTDWSFDDATNPRRIKIRVDATRNGKTIADQENERFIFIQDGGQLYYPLEPCQIRISSPYTGDENSHMKGRVESCVVHSAGIEHTVSASFEVLGAPKWKTKDEYDF